jgi:predicted  nucleic acid-binding Zn-ribbon protein
MSLLSPTTPISESTTQASTPGTISTFSLSLHTKLPFQTTYEEYEKFITEISPNTINQGLDSTPILNGYRTEILDPVLFSSYLDSVKHLESRLNYRFLELEAKLRFLRLLTAGTELSNTEISAIDTDLESLQQKITGLEDNVEELKKIGKILRKKIGKCFHQTEIRRCIEGKPILEDETKSLLDEIDECRIFFQSNGLLKEHNKNNESNNIDLIGWAKSLVDDNIIGGIDLLKTNINKVKNEDDEMKKTLADLKSTYDNINEEDNQIDDELQQLEIEKEKLKLKLENLSNHQITNDETELLNKFNILNQLLDVWKAF